MRHDKLRQDVEPRPEGEAIPHQGIADQLPVPDPDDIEEDIEEEAAIPEIEVKARQQGWRPKDEWQGDPDDWVSAKRWVETGELMRANKILHGEVENLKTDFNTRMNNMRTLHEQQLQVHLNQLKLERSQAIDNADTEKFNEIDKQINELSQGVETPQPPSPQQSPADLMKNIYQHPVFLDWQRKNTWSQENSPKTAFAEREFIGWLSQNINRSDATLEEGLSHVDSIVAQHFPETNQQRARPAMSTKKGKPNGKTKPLLTMNDLQPHEQLIWDSMGHSWKNQEDFLQAVRDNREADKL